MNETVQFRVLAEDEALRTRESSSKRRPIGYWSPLLASLCRGQVVEMDAGDELEQFMKRVYMDGSLRGYAVRTDRQIGGGRRIWFEPKASS